MKRSPRRSIKRNLSRLQAGRDRRCYFGRDVLDATRRRGPATPIEHRVTPSPALRGQRRSLAVSSPGGQRTAALRLHPGSGRYHDSLSSPTPSLPRHSQTNPRSAAGIVIRTAPQGLPGPRHSDSATDIVKDLVPNISVYILYDILPNISIICTDIPCLLADKMF